MAGAARLEQIPPDTLFEVAFAGRSNVGKSSLLNALLNRKSLARVSSSPGCTRQVNFFNLCNRMLLVDMPGYGYAKTSKQDAKNWGALISGYLSGRVSLRRVFLLIDARRGVQEIDLGIMKILNEAAVSFQIVLTKVDELSPDEQNSALSQAEKIATKQPAAMQQVLLTSSETKTGLDTLKEIIFGIVAA